MVLNDFRCEDPRQDGEGKLHNLLLRKDHLIFSSEPEALCPVAFLRTWCRNPFFQRPPPPPSRNPISFLKLTRTLVVPSPLHRLAIRGTVVHWMAFFHGGDAIEHCCCRIPLSFADTHVKVLPRCRAFDFDEPGVGHAARSGDAGGGVGGSSRESHACACSFVCASEISGVTVWCVFVHVHVCMRRLVLRKERRMRLSPACQVEHTVDVRAQIGTINLPETPRPLERTVAS